MVVLEYVLFVGICNLAKGVSGAGDPEALTGSVGGQLKDMTQYYSISGLLNTYYQLTVKTLLVRNQFRAPVYVCESTRAKS